MQRGRMLLLVSMLCVLAVCSRSGADDDLPEGWRLPTSQELADAWRSRSPERFAVAKGDFDRDGREDRAYLVISEDGKRTGLVARLSGNGSRWFTLDDSEGSALVMGLETNPPGRYPVLCREADTECKDGKAPFVIPSESISYYRVASSGSIFVWNREKQSFDRLWDSD